MKVKLDMALGIGFPTAAHRGTEEIEVDDDSTDEEIEDEANDYLTEWANNRIDMAVIFTKVQP